MAAKAKSSGVTKGIKKKVKKPAYRQRVLIEFIQDRSGSMNATWSEDLNGFKVFVDTLKADKSVDQWMSLTVFDSLNEQPFTGVPVSEVDAAVLAKYGPRGGTALYDALGTALARVQPREGDFDKIIVVVVTDGQENMSSRFNKTALHAAIDARLNTGKYTFTYLGTQPETWQDAASLGMSAGNTVKISASRGLRGSTYSVMAQSLNNFKSSDMASTRSLYGSFGDKENLYAAKMEVADDEIPAGIPDVMTTFRK